MKKNKLNQFNFNELNNDELSTINGGTFAYDLGRFLRYIGIYCANGTGIPGTVAANIDLATNIYLNE